MKEHIVKQTQLLEQEDGITVLINENELHGYYRGYCKSDDFLALRLEGLDDQGRTRVVPIPGDIIEHIKADDDVKSGNVVEVGIIDTKTQRTVLMTFIRSEDTKNVSIEMKLDSDEISQNSDAFYLRLAATLIENFRVLARNIDVEIRENIEGK